MTEAEWLTRKKRIDTWLRSLNPKWEIVHYREGLDLSTLQHHAVEEFPTDNGPADYALFVNGALLGIIEAKRVTVGPQNVLEQAKRYSQGVTDGIGNWNGYLNIHGIRTRHIIPENTNAVDTIVALTPAGLARL
jgi:type I restriction enzyme R subunit